MRLGLGEVVDLDSHLVPLPILIGLIEHHALAQLVELLIEQLEVLGHNLVRGLFHGSHLALPRLQTTERLVWLDNVENERVALSLLR